MRTKEMTAMVARHTGWSLEYIGLLSFRRLKQLVADFEYQRAVELYRIEFRIGQLLAMTASGKNRTYKAQDFVGEMPKRTEVAMGKSKEPFEVVLGDGNSYHLAMLDANIMEQLEEEFNQGWEQLMTNVRIKTLKSLLYYLLNPTYPNLTKNDVGKLLTGGVFESVVVAISRMV